MTAPPTVFLVTLQAVEAPGAGPLTVLAFARAADEDTARSVAVADLESFGWTDIAIQRTGELVDWAALPDDFGSAVDTAVKHGCGLIIYDEP